MGPFIGFRLGLGLLQRRLMGLFIGLGLGLDFLQRLLTGREIGLRLGQLFAQLHHLRGIAGGLGVQRLHDLVQRGDVVHLFQQLGGERFQLPVGRVQPGPGVLHGLLGLGDRRLKALPQGVQGRDALLLRPFAAGVLHDGHHLIPDGVQVDVGNRFGHFASIGLQSGNRHDGLLQIDDRLRQGPGVAGFLSGVRGLRIRFGRFGSGLRFGFRSRHGRNVRFLLPQALNDRVLIGNHGVQPLDGRVLLGNHDVQALDGHVLFGNRGVQVLDGRVLFGNRGVQALDGRVLFGNRGVQVPNGRVLPGNQPAQRRDGGALLADQALQLGHPGLCLGRLGLQRGHLGIGGGQVRLQLLGGGLAALHPGVQVLNLGPCLLQLGADVVILGLGRLQVRLQRLGIALRFRQLGLRGGEGFLAGVQLVVEQQYRDDGEHQQRQQHDLPDFAFGIHNTASLCTIL